MPRWKALSDELDPQVREFAGQLRRLVDRGGMSIAAVVRTPWRTAFRATALRTTASRVSTYGRVSAV
ncbi:MULTISPECIES: hypothetical protein [unclassified Streptomyces]|uniref:hypothetical protein n=1 Tax=unclassified Streptomyces TaxID=2593676 RepID=UPI0036E12ACF